MAGYPEHPWNLQQFSRPVRDHTARQPRGYWDDINNQRTFITQLAKKLSITNEEGWYNITHKTLQEHGGAGLINHYESLSKLLTTLCPEYTQMCRTLVMKIVHDLKLAQVKDVISLPKQYLDVGYALTVCGTFPVTNLEYFSSMTTRC